MQGVLSVDSNVITVTPVSLPPPPMDLGFSVRSDSIEVSWSSSGEGVCYNIYRAVKKDGHEDSLVNREPVCGLRFEDKTLSPGKRVYYTVRALSPLDRLSEGYASSPLEVSPAHFVPSPPSHLRVVTGDGAVFLLWKESPESWVRGYRVYRKRTGESEWSLIGEVEVPSFVDAVKPEGKARYLIRALGPAAESEPLEGEIEAGKESR